MTSSLGASLDGERARARVRRAVRIDAFARAKRDVKHSKRTFVCVDIAFVLRFLLKANVDATRAG